MILELTLMSGKKVLVNFDLVTDVSEHNGSTIIGFGRGDYYVSVTEPYDQIKGSWT